ncbi:double Clp-N motif-containing P-loop nucleoside triphosphate hydrolases superfamily protein [Tasmannia lanceolata]|uniref:double Clp-N motif-containing P-loop nucleoside triphosphate hydrolases superfamily protein n=1 Tax=Tasmannia lanceolata TaxID=3420 RepID=UPI004062910E
MRTGLSTIQQTLTPEAASVLNHSIAEAGRRNHGQTTPLHVAATLLASPSGYLRQACIRSHPNSSHPLQCRALELCFSVALERLPSAQNLSPGLEPPISNALMAALKRAQAHQRRGCPEQQQQPLLAVKVELEQLIVSILDDPSVSRVMREASFSSPAVKATIEQSLNSSGSVNSSTIGGGGGGLGLGFRPNSTMNRNLYMNPRLQPGSCEQSGQQRREEVKRVIDILLRSKKKNPVLVGESEPEIVMRELLQRIEKNEIGEGMIKNVQVVSLQKEFGSDRSQITMKLKELGNLIENRISSTRGCNGVVLDLGDLKWLVEQPMRFGVPGSGSIQQQILSETGRAVIAEMGKLLARFGEGNHRLWLIGTATCETYLRCQVYHPSMENDWDLQAVPITARSPIPGLFPRLRGNGILSSSVESLTPIKGFPIEGTTCSTKRQSENTDPAREVNCCPTCLKNYEHELTKLLGKECEKPTSDAKPESRQPLPQWMQIAKLNNGGIKAVEQPQSKDEELILKQKTEELQRKWNDTCRHLHPSFFIQTIASERSLPTTPSTTSLYNSNLVGRQPFQPKLHPTRNPTTTLQMNHNLIPNPSERPTTPPPRSPVRTDLVLGRPKIPEQQSLENTHKERIKDFPGCVQDKFSNWQNEKHAIALDADSFKRLFKGLTEKVGWQSEAASAVATTVIQCKSGNGRRRGVGAKGDSWLLFAGPDKVGKRKMASALSELVYGSNPITIHLRSRAEETEESDMNFRGKTVLDRVAEAVKRNPFSVVVLEDIDKADMLVHSSLKRAIEKGRLTDSYGREFGLGSVIFILTANWVPENLKNSNSLNLNSPPLLEEKLAAEVVRGWELQLLVCRKSGKRRPEWNQEDNRVIKPRKDGSPGAISFDLNLAADVNEEPTEGSRNSSDLTVDHENDHGLTNKWRVQSSAELFDSMDDTIVFKHVDFAPLRRKVAETIGVKFEGRSIEVDDDVLDRIVGGVWFGQTGLEEWVDRVLVPAFQQLKKSFPVDDSTVFRLLPVRGGHVPVSESRSSSGRDFLPSKITVVADGL